MDDIELWKDGELVGESVPAPEATGLVLEEGPKWPGTGDMACFYFPRLRLSPPVIWKVLAGTALGHFLDHCTLQRKAGHRIEDLRYVHGRAETMKGKPTVSTVLLARVRTDLPNDRWLTYLPAIYQEFLRRYDAGTKAS